MRMQPQERKYAWKRLFTVHKVMGGQVPGSQLSYRARADENILRGVPNCTRYVNCIQRQESQPRSLFNFLCKVVILFLIFSQLGAPEIYQRNLD